MDQPAAPTPRAWRRRTGRLAAALLLAATLGGGAAPLAGAATPPPGATPREGGTGALATPRPDRDDAPARNGPGAPAAPTPDPGAATAVPPTADPTAPAGTGEIDVDAPATAADNRGLTAERIDAWIARAAPDSPLRGLGAFILAEADRRDLSVPLFLGIARKESALGLTAGPGKALTRITDPARDGGLGQPRAYRSFATWQVAILATFDLLDGDPYRGRGLTEQIGAWYVGPAEFARAGLDMTDRAGNGTVRDYLGVVAAVYRGLGQTPGGAAPIVGTGLAAIWGGADAPILQGFGNTAFARGNPVYDYGRQFGVSGHTGLDIGLAHGTPPPAPATGAVSASGSAPVNAALGYLGAPYVWGGNTPAGWDCSGFVVYVYREITGRTLPRTTQAQWGVGTPVAREAIRAGDLVFFQNTYAAGITHVGIALGDGRFVHARGPGYGTVISNLADPYYAAHYAGARRP